MMSELIGKYKFVYKEDCCASASKQDLVACDSCGKDVCIKCGVIMDGVRLHRECSVSRRHNLVLLKLFRDRNLALKDSLLLQGLELEVSKVRGDKQKPSCTIDITAPAFLANLIMWSSGECECEVISSVTGNQLFWKHKILNTEPELESYLNDIYGVISELNKNTC